MANISRAGVLMRPLQQTCRQCSLLTRPGIDGSLDTTSQLITIRHASQYATAKPKRRPRRKAGEPSTGRPWITTAEAKARGERANLSGDSQSPSLLSEGSGWTDIWPPITEPPEPLPLIFPWDGKDATALSHNILRSAFGHSVFRHEQEAAIDALLQGHNVLTVFPTGGGKSLCFQIPALAFPTMDVAASTDDQEPPRAEDSHGITLVVSPLLALMKDQVDTLRAKGVPADRLDSTRTTAEVMGLMNDVMNGKLRLLYCAPERLNNEMFLSRIKKLKGGIRLLAIDEAHCVSEWGHTFRPDYLKIARFVKETKAERVLCLTATATPLVTHDVCKAFDIAPSGVFRTSPYRPNLTLEAIPLQNVLRKFKPLREYLGSHPGATIIYVTRQNQAERLAARLTTYGYSAAAYHADISPLNKKEIQEGLMTNNIRIVVATIAFGMGIDKPDIRNIVHYDLPSSVEEYSQQIGRAGRDGGPSTCITFVCPHDLYIPEVFARGGLPSRQSVADMLTDVMFAAKGCSVGDSFAVDRSEQSASFDIAEKAVTNIYALLELYHGLVCEITPQWSKYRFTPLGPECIEAMALDTSPVGQAIQQHSGRASSSRTVNIDEAIKDTGLSRSEIIHHLHKLEESGIIKLGGAGLRHRYRITAPFPQTRAEFDGLAEKIYARLQEREALALTKSDAMISLITGAHCYSHALAEYFTTSLPGGTDHCGHCHFCKTGEAIAMPEIQRPELNQETLKRLLEQVPERDDARFLAKVAFGVGSPRTRAMGYDRKDIFGSLSDQKFTTLLEIFENECDKVRPKKARTTMGNAPVDITQGDMSGFGLDEGYLPPSLPVSQADRMV